MINLDRAPRIQKAGGGKSCMVVNAGAEGISDEDCGEEHPAVCQIDCTRLWSVVLNISMACNILRSADKIKILLTYLIS